MAAAVAAAAASVVADTEFAAFQVHALTFLVPCFL